MYSVAYNLGRCTGNTPEPATALGLPANSVREYGHARQQGGGVILSQGGVISSLGSNDWGVILSGESFYSPTTVVYTSIIDVIIRQNVYAIH